MLKEIILHIGAEKTGTTSIQEFLALNRSALRSAGIWFSSAFGGRNHLKLTLASVDPKRAILRQARYAALQKDLVTFRERVRLELDRDVRKSGASRLVLSNEHMHSQLHTAEELIRLKSLLPAAEAVSIVFYVRRQDRTAVSLYSTALKAGGKRAGFTFDSTRGKALRYDYAAAFKLWASVFGEQAVRVRIFDRTEMLEGDLLKDFCAAARLPWSAAYSPPRNRNTSLDINGEYIFRHFNEIRKEPGAVISKTTQKRLRGFLAARFSGGDKVRPLRKDAQAFLAKFDPSNEELRQLAFPGRAKPVFNADFSDYPTHAASGEVDHELICRTLLTAWIQETRPRRSLRRSAVGASLNRLAGVKGGVKSAVQGLLAKLVGRTVLNRPGKGNKPS
jgi:hypothetical protein